MANAGKKLSILCVHQGFELYGCDRVLIDSLNVIKKHFPEYQLDIFLPQKGALYDVLSTSHKVQIKKIGVLRKRDFRKFDLRSIFQLVFGFFKARKEVKKYGYTYINSVVIIDYIIASGLSKSTNFIHVHEIPTGIIRFFFGMILMLFADYVIFNSVATQRAFRFYVKFKKTFVVYNGFEGFSTDRIIKKYSSEKINLLIMGRINPLKGQLLLLDAINLMPEVYKSKIKLKIVGSVFKDEVQFKEQLVQKIIRYQLENHVEIIPFLTNTFEMYNWADVLIVPSVRPESFGLTAVEAMSIGHPVIASAHGGIVEIVQHEVTGLLFKPNACESLKDSIIRLMDNPYLIDEYGEKGKIRFKQMFTYESYQKNFSECMQSILHNKK